MYNCNVICLSHEDQPIYPDHDVIRDKVIVLRNWPNNYESLTHC